MSWTRGVHQRMPFDATTEDWTAERRRVDRELEAARNVGEAVHRIAARDRDELTIRVRRGRRSVVLTRADAVALIGELAEAVANPERFGVAAIEIGE